MKIVSRGNFDTISGTAFRAPSEQGTASLIPGTSETIENRAVFAAIGLKHPLSNRLARGRVPAKAQALHGRRH